MVLLGIGFVAMIVISAIYFSSLGLKKIMVFNALYLGSCLLLFVGLPGSILLLFHVIILATYVAVAKMG